jgi:hypothetical protein
VNAAPSYIDTTWIGGLEISAPPQELWVSDSRFERTPDASVGPTDDWIRPFGNDRLNARTHCSLPQGKWVVAWKTPLPTRISSGHLLWHAGRILLEGISEWLLCDATGTALARGALDSGGITIDPGRGVFYVMTPSGYLAARRLTDGSAAFFMQVEYGNVFSHPYLAPLKNLLLASGRERQLIPNATSPLAASLQLMDLGAHLEMDKDRLLTSFRTIKTLMRSNGTLLMALNGDSVVLATDDHLYIADTELTFRKLYTGQFVPSAMSLDESGNMYLVARVFHSRPMLLACTPEGRIFCTVDLHHPLEVQTPPPPIGFDHTIFVLQGERVHAFTQTGLQRWSAYGGGHVAGSVVTPEGILITTAGSLLCAFDPDGNRTILQHFPGEALCTPPLLCADASMHLATEDHLYKLVIGKE